MKLKNALLDTESTNLVKAAEETLEKHYKKGKHHVACALLAASGKVYVGVHLDCAGYDTCAEPTSIAQAVLADEKDLALIVAVMRKVGTNENVIVNPCGNCLQHFLIFAPKIEIITQTKEGVKRLPLHALIPYPYDFN